MKDPLVHSKCCTCQHPFDFDWPDLGLAYACPNCHRIHHQVMIEIFEEPLFLLGEATPDFRTWQPEIRFIDGQPTEIPFQRNLN